jgi:hypothetical protein
MSTEEFTLDATDIRTYFNKNIIKGRRQYGEYRVIYKDPDESDLYFFDWIEDLAPDENITDSVVLSEGEITVDNTSVNPVESIVPVRVSGGDTGKYLIVNRITTSLGRILEKSFKLIVG